MCLKVMLPISSGGVATVQTIASSSVHWDLDVALVLCCEDPIAHGETIPDPVVHAPYWCVVHGEMCSARDPGGLMPAGRMTAMTVSNVPRSSCDCVTIIKKGALWDLLSVCQKAARTRLSARQWSNLRNGRSGREPTFPPLRRKGMSWSEAAAAVRPRFRRSDALPRSPNRSFIQHALCLRLPLRPARP